MFHRSLGRILRLLLVFPFVLAACAPAATTVANPSASATPQQTTAYPVTIAHKYGETTLTKFPERIVLVGLTEQDALLALGIVPVATREWWGERPGAIFEWAKDELGNAPLPTVLSGEALNFEQIASLKPDVIVGLYAGLTEEEYKTLSQIAPTVAQPGEHPDWGIPWQELTRKIGLIIGKGPQAEALITDLEARFAQVREQHPEFAKAPGVVTSSMDHDAFWAYSSKDPRGQFLTSLGFKTPTKIDEQVGSEFGASLSRERLDLLNEMGVVVWFMDKEEPTNDPIYKQLTVSKEGRNVSINWLDPLAFAFSFNTVLSLPYVLDNLVPRLAAAADGDPATSLEQTPTTVETRVIDTARGKVTVPATPQRVVALGQEEMLADLLDAGVTVVASSANIPENTAGFDPKELKDILIFPAHEPNLETIVSLKPDLIVGSIFFVESIGYDKLTAIAPTVAIDATQDWRQTYIETLAVFGKGEKAQSDLANYDVNLSAARTKLNVQGRSVSVGTIYPGAALAAWVDGPTAIPQLLIELGFTLSPSAESAKDFGPKNGRIFINMEQLNLFKADTLILLQSSLVEGEAQALADVKANPLWAQVPAVKGGHAFELDRLGYPGLRGRIMLLADVVRLLQP